jgi:periplasmic protein TonB
MDDTLQPPGAVPQLKPHKNLLIGIAASVALHLIFALVLLGLPSGPPQHTQSVTYLDLKALQAPAPMEAPSKTAPVPETLPEDQPPVQPPPVQQAQPAANSAPQATQQTKVEEERTRTVMGLGLTKGYFKSIAEGETLRVGIREYYLDMLQVVNEKWWLDQQIDKRRVAPIVINITVARNGEILACNVMKTSGDRRYDKAVVAALIAASPLPPLPPSFTGDVFQAPIRLVPPLNLMAW